MKIICIGRNYSDHARELGNDIPTEPLYFLKPDTALLRNNFPFFIPDFSRDLHYEAEVLLKICKVGKYIQPRFAHRYYDMIGLGVDFTARDLQEEAKKKGLPWEKCKGFDGSAAVSKFISKTEFPNSAHIGFHLDINGTTVQQGNTRDLIFPFDQIIAHVSKFMTLKTGDIIFTGTPAGVGPVKHNDRLQGFIGERKMFDFYIK